MIKFRKFNINCHRLSSLRNKWSCQVVMVPCLPGQGTDVESRLSIRGVPYWAEIAWPVPGLSQLWVGSCPENIESLSWKLRPTLMKLTAEPYHSHPHTWSSFGYKWYISMSTQHNKYHYLIHIHIHQLSSNTLHSKFLPIRSFYLGGKCFKKLPR